MTNIKEIPENKEEFLYPNFRELSGVEKYMMYELFIDKRGDEDLAVYTSEDYDQEVDGVIYKSLKQLYLDEEDITEYRFAVKYFYNFEQWRRLTKLKGFQKQLKNWRLELQLKLQSEGIKGVISSARGGNSNMSKYLANKGFLPDNRTSSKEDKDSEKERTNELYEKISQDCEDDLKRIANITQI